ncbi:hypothetical protein GCM10011351_19300 [Paraliobacillus quinghaiensis]|uniref:Uncharacterized protein n=1 Tax=Paraliobacillus quinghaiensis TaxID=470815 RepID=A0A917TQZ9_9BACI|nr:hypothetical protein [Paraliobacillus quinghaiensis]GGM33397.1 hypothetical protein GCM10011351_19300 [Paraliobacillus quinghaiensis]
MRKWLVFLFLLLIISFSVVGMLQNSPTHGTEVETTIEKNFIQNS